MNGHPPRIPQLNDRSREIFRQIVDAYLNTGQPAGSRQIARMLPMTLSPASVRNVMADLESLGLIRAPHSSAGRQPTEQGLRFFVDALMEVKNLTDADQSLIAQHVSSAAHKSVDGILKDASSLLSDLSRGAGIVMVSKHDPRLKHIEFLALDASRALVILVDEDGSVENRILPLPAGLPASALVEAGNYLNAHVRGRTLGEARAEIARNRDQTQRELDSLASRLVELGLASWTTNDEGFEPQLIVRGQANLLEDVNESNDLERVRHLLGDIENQKDLIDLLSVSEQAEGVRIYIGSENRLFSLSGSSMVVAPFHNNEQKLVGAIGIIGPKRLNYARIVPLVDYTAQLVGRLTS